MSESTNEELKSYCQWPRCNKDSDIICLGKGLCDKHWEEYCKLPLEQAHQKLGVENGDANQVQADIQASLKPISEG